MKNLPFLLFPVLIFFLGACRKIGMTPDVRHVKDYFPLAVGNEWQYEVYRYHTGDHPGGLAGRASLRVIGTQEIQGKQYYQLERDATTRLLFPEFLRRCRPGNLARKGAAPAHMAGADWVSYSEKCLAAFDQNYPPVRDRRWENLDTSCFKLTFQRPNNPGCGILQLRAIGTRVWSI